MALTMTLLAALPPLPPIEQIWPTSVSGWVALVASLASLITVVAGGALAWGKWVAIVDGFGTRLGGCEANLTAMAGANTERVRRLDKIEHDHANLILGVGEAKQSGSQCREEAADHALTLGSRASELDRKVTTFELGMSNRLTAIEKDIEHLREIRK